MLVQAATLVLGPVLFAQARRVRATALELPEADGPREGEEGRGDRTLHLLVVGDSSAAGVGATHQDEALARPLARSVAEGKGVKVRWQLVARSGATSRDALCLLKDRPPERADVAVIMLGVNDITHRVPVARALAHKAELVDWLRDDRGVEQVVFCELPPMERFPALPQPLAWYCGLAAHRVNRAQARWAGLRPGVRHADMGGVMRAGLFAQDGFHPGPELYARIARRLADHVCALPRAVRSSDP